MMSRQHLRFGVWNTKIKFTLLNTDLVIPETLSRYSERFQLVYTWIKQMLALRTSQIKFILEKKMAFFVHICLGDLSFTIVQCTLLLCRCLWNTVSCWLQIHTYSTDVVMYHNHTYLREPICRQVHMKSKCNIKHVSTSLFIVNFTAGK